MSSIEAWIHIMEHDGETVILDDGTEATLIAPEIRASDAER